MVADCERNFFPLGGQWCRSRRLFGCVPQKLGTPNNPIVIGLEMIHCASRWRRQALLFCGSDRGGDRAAILYTLIQTAKLNDVDPQA